MAEKGRSFLLSHPCLASFNAVKGIKLKSQTLIA